jgi:SAM-dependent methyltransferase
LEPTIDPKWNRRYAEQDTPWNMGFPSRELTRVLDAGLISGKSVFEFGCGIGTNAILLATRGYAVTAVDGASLAIEQARNHTNLRDLDIEFFEADVCTLANHQEILAGRTFDVVFDRGCFHCVRSVNAAGYLESLKLVTHAGSRFLLLTGNANEQREGGPPRLHEQELRSDFESLFVIDEMRPFRFDDPDGPTGPLGWCCLMTRRENSV